jgi:thiol reductant ABC exporter CydD subunit
MSSSGRRRPPVDPRLWRHARSFRRWLAASVAIGLGLTICLVAQASFLALALALTDAVGHRGDHRSLSFAVAGLVAATIARAGLALAAEQASTGAASRTKMELRARAITSLAARKPLSVAARSTGDLAITIGHGLDALDDYIGRYLPRLILAFLAPIVLLVWIAHLDVLSAGIITVTLLLLPVFMILVGQLTQRRVDEQWQVLTSLSGQFLDAVEGQATLRAFGRSQAQNRTIAISTEKLRRTTMGTLRVALLSALVLETLAALGTALVAVPLGLRLVSSQIGLTSALTILILTPEVYLPLRRASADFHANAQGAAALDAVFMILEGTETPKQPETSDTIRRPKSDAVGIQLRKVWVSYPGQDHPALHNFGFELLAGEHVGVRGPSGAGKSTLVGVLAGLIIPGRGEVLVDGIDICAVGVDVWRSQLTWVPQRPMIFSGTIAENLRIAAPHASDAELWQALELACLDSLVASLPGGLKAPLVERAEQLSAGERQRLGIARAMVRRQTGLILLDEPTAHLDPATEAAVVEKLGPVLAGRSTVIVTHRTTPLSLVDRVIELAPPERPDDSPDLLVATR